MTRHDEESPGSGPAPAGPPPGSGGPAGGDPDRSTETTGSWAFISPRFIVLLRVTAENLSPQPVAYGYIIVSLVTSWAFYLLRYANDVAPLFKLVPCQVSIVWGVRKV